MHVWQNIVFKFLVTALVSSTCQRPDDTGNSIDADIHDQLSCDFNQTSCGWSLNGWSFIYGSADPRLSTYCDFSQLCGYNFTNSTWRTGRDSQGSPYVYVDTTFRGFTSRLLTPEFPASPSDFCLQFYYYIGNDNLGTLSVKMTPSNGDSGDLLLWAESRSTNLTLAYVSILADNLTRDFKLAFDVHIPFGQQPGTIAVKSVRTAPKPCPADGDCSFEVICSYWPYNQATPAFWDYASSSHIPPKGPSDDHTFNNKRGRYLYVSGRGQANLTSSYLPPYKCVSFWYYCTPGNHNSLALLQNSGGVWANVWNSSENTCTEMWTSARVSLWNTRVVQVQFLGQNGAYGVTAIDDIKFHSTCQADDIEYVHGVVATMSNKQEGWYANLSSDSFCTLINRPYIMTTRYRINCQSAMCKLIVSLIHEDGRREQLLIDALYSNQTLTRTAMIMPHAGEVFIFIETWKINTSGWALQVLVESVSLEGSTTPLSTRAQSTPSTLPPHLVSGDIDKTTDSSLALGIGVGIGIGATLLVATVLVVIVVAARRRKEQRQAETSSQSVSELDVVDANTNISRPSETPRVVSTAQEECPYEDVGATGGIYYSTLAQRSNADCTYSSLQNTKGNDTGKASDSQEGEYTKLHFASPRIAQDSDAGNQVMLQGVN